jgi:hypothetical protein
MINSPHDICPTAVSARVLLRDQIDTSTMKLEGLEPGPAM